MMVPCRRCAGTGEYPPTGGDQCSWCAGRGEVYDDDPAAQPTEGDDE